MDSFLLLPSQVLRPSSYANNLIRADRENSPVGDGGMQPGVSDLIDELGEEEDEEGDVFGNIAGSGSVPAVSDYSGLYGTHSNSVQ